MKKIWLYLLFTFGVSSFAQQSDFDSTSFTKADRIAKTYKSKGLIEVNKLTFQLTKDLTTDVEKFRAIYIWIAHNISNNHRMYLKNNRKKKRFKNDSVRLDEWNSKFKKDLFKKLLRNKTTICTGYALLLKEMCAVVGIEAHIVQGFGRTAVIDLSSLDFPNHTWNIVKLNNKWYLCDATWSSGFSNTETNEFKFKYNDGYFLTEPELFAKTHFPLQKELTLLPKNSMSYVEFSEAPLLYEDAYNMLDKHLLPLKMHNEIKKNEIVQFQYELKKKTDIKKVNLVLSSGSNEKYEKPNVSLEDNVLSLFYQFKRTGFYDVHLYFDKNLIATYTFRVSK